MKKTVDELIEPTQAPIVTVIEFSDPTEVGESMDLVQQDVVQLESKKLKVLRVIVRLSSFIVLYHHTNLAVRTRTKLPDEFAAYTALAPNSHATVNGEPFDPDRFLACLPGVEMEIVVNAGYESIAILVPPDDVRNQLQRRQQFNELHCQKGVELLSPNPECLHDLYSWGRRITKIAARKPDLFDAPQSRSVAKIELLERLLLVLESVTVVDVIPQDTTRQGHSRIVQLVEDYALAHAAERLHVSDLCEVAGVSERTLQYAFKEVMGMTPLSYLTRLRLHRVRQALRSAPPGSTTVTAEALRWGFWNFGDFARTYRECFGEVPSNTLNHKRR